MNKRFCCENISKIENYDLAKKDNFKGWHWKVIDGKRAWLPVKKEAKGVETQIQRH